MDVLRVPIVGPALRWRYARLSLQLALLAITVAVVLHGFLGSQIAPAQPRHRPDVGALARAPGRGTHRRWAICSAPPARWCSRATPAGVFHANRAWPRRLRGKWLGLGLLVQCSSPTSCFDMWELPACHRLVVAGYFGAGPSSWTSRSRARRSASISARSASSTSSRPRCRRPSFRCATRHLPALPTSDCIKGRRERRRAGASRAAGLRVGPFPAGKGRQPRLHAVPGLHPRLPARQHRARHPCARAPSCSTPAADPAWDR